MNQEFTFKLMQKQPAMKTVLFIESDAWYRLCFCEFLCLTGFQPIEAKDGFTGLKMAQKLHPNLILCDVDLSDIAGTEVLLFLRQNSITAKIPFIFLAASPNTPEYNLTLKLGANEYLARTLPNQTLLQAIIKHSKQKSLTLFSFYSQDHGS